MENLLSDASAVVSQHLAVMNPTTFNLTEFLIFYFQRNIFMSILGVISFAGVVGYWEYIDGLFQFEWKKSTDRNFGISSHHRFN